MRKRETPFFLLISAICFVLLGACSSTANSQNRPSHSGPASQPPAAAVEAIPPTAICPEPEALPCEPQPDLATEAALRKLVLGNDWHREGRYTAAMEAYESVLVEHASLQADAYALWGIIAVRLDRDNPAYDRESARTVSYVLDQRIHSALGDESIAEARLLWFGAQVMLAADVSKDGVVAENRRLQQELTQREEAIQRLRELTVGR